MSDMAGRSCPLRYRYGAEAIARLSAIDAETLYVVGGLYGNLPALDTIERMAAAEPGPVTQKLQMASQTGSSRPTQVGRVSSATMPSAPHFSVLRVPSHAGNRTNFGTL